MTTAASPEATGHAGPFFEQHVDAAFLALLLVRATPPFMLQCELAEVHLQAGHLGWATDDLLLVGVDNSGLRRKAAIQVKRTFTMASSDDECVEVFKNAWIDFKSERFDAGTDVVGLVTRPLAQRTQHGLRILLDTARAAADGADFLRRLAIPGYRDKAAAHYATIIRNIIEAHESTTISDGDFRSFLRCFDFTCLDLNTEASTTEALLLTLLRACANEEAGPSAGVDTWNELKSLVARNSQDARTFRWVDLPAETRQRHHARNSISGATFDSLSEMTRTVCAGIDADVAGHHVARIQLEYQALRMLDENRILIITGLAGSGKSALAKTVFEATTTGDFSIAMRAEMLARSHLAETLFVQSVTIPRLKALAALHPRKLLWIESGERFLEKPPAERGAFSDLLRLIRGDESWRVIITCRTYSVETLRSALLDGAGMPIATLVVPPLMDDELNGVAVACPQLGHPLSSEPLRSLLRNPFLLSKAARMHWTSSSELPQNERAFRIRVWREVIRKDDEPADGMPQRRGEAYLSLARRRAQALEPFVDASDLDALALQRLKADTLAFESRDVNDYWAPAHDVLEDWALLEWLDREFVQARRGWPEFFSKIGTHPAIRRAFRIWLSERLTDPNLPTDADIATLVRDPALPSHWKDDALVALLSGYDPAMFLTRNAGLMLADNAELACRALHLARVACKEAPPEPSKSVRSSIGLLPVGPAWARLAQFVADNLAKFLHADPLLSRFVEDWALSATWEEPYPPSADAVGQIVLGLLASGSLSRSTRSERLHRLLKVLLKIPKTAESKIKAISDECMAMDPFNHEHVFVRFAMSHFHGGCLCRDYPMLVVQLLRRMLEPDEPRDTHEDGWLPRVEREDSHDAFGLPMRLRYYGIPASAYHGPFLNLLRFHPDLGLEVVIKFVNRAAASYLDHHGQRFRGAIVNLDLQLPSGARVVHRGDACLWNLYRVNCGPEFLRSALMALESFLLELGNQYPKLLPAALGRIMAEATNVALTAIVASVAMAFPRQIGDAVLSLLANRVVFDWDHNRLVNDLVNAEQHVANWFPDTSIENHLFKKERAEAAEQRHRKFDLRQLVLELQLTPLRDQVWAMLDRHHEQLPPSNEQGENDKLWRLQLHRMDLRNFKPADQPEDGFRVWQPSPPPPEVNAIVVRDRPRFESQEHLDKLLRWGSSCYERKNEPSYPAENWRTILSEVQRHEDGEAWELHDARLVVAMVCLRDSLEVMNDDERDWCIQTMTIAVVTKANDGDARARLPLGPRRFVGDAALELSGILAKEITLPQRRLVEDALASALLCGNDDVRLYASAGIGRYLWRSDRELALSCVNALITHARLEREAMVATLRKSLADDYSQRRELEAAALIKARGLITDRVAAGSEILELDYRKPPWRGVLRELINIFEQAGDELASRFFTRLGEQLRSSWEDEDAHRNRYRQGKETIFECDAERRIMSGMSYFGLGLDPASAVDLFRPFVEAASEHPAKVAALMKQLARMEDLRFAPKSFWAVWSTLSPVLVQAFNARTANATLQHENEEVAQVLFLNLNWKETTTEWRSLSGYEERISTTYAAMSPHSVANEEFAGFLYKIGAVLLPDVIPIMAEKLSSGQSVLNDSAVHLLELILVRLVHGGEPRIRRDASLRAATIRILDALIDAGSSLAYRLRDDFVTPVRQDYELTSEPGTNSNEVS
jgi:hypothetical protein